MFNMRYKTEGTGLQWKKRYKLKFTMRYTDLTNIWYRISQTENTIRQQQIYKLKEEKTKKNDFQQVQRKGVSIILKKRVYIMSHWFNYTH